MAAHAGPECGIDRPSSSTTGSRFRMVEVMNTSSARSTSARISVPSAMVYPGTRHGRENGDYRCNGVGRSPE
jgi:hypothetical protein